MFTLATADATGADVGVRNGDGVAATGVVVCARVADRVAAAVGDAGELGVSCATASAHSETAKRSRIIA